MSANAAPRKSRRLSPGEIVVQRFEAAGISARQLSKLLGRDHSRIVRLTKPKQAGGTAGQIPPALQRRLLEIAPAHGVQLTAEELITGGSA